MFVPKIENVDAVLLLINFFSAGRARLIPAYDVFTALFQKYSTDIQCSTT